MFQITSGTQTFSNISARIWNSLVVNMCVGATKGTCRRDIKIIVNHDYIKQCIIFTKIFFTDYTSKYCLLSIQLTSACIYTPQHTNFGCFVCACY